VLAVLRRAVGRDPGDEVDEGSVRIDDAGGEDAPLVVDLVAVDGLIRPGAHGTGAVGAEGVAPGDGRAEGRGLPERGAGGGVDAADDVGHRGQDHDVVRGAVGQRNAGQDEGLGFDTSRVAENGDGGDSGDAFGFDIGLGEDGFLLVPSGAVVIPCAGEERGHGRLRGCRCGAGEDTEQSDVGLHGSSRGVWMIRYGRFFLCCGSEWKLGSKDVSR
jgi:hypothetical protein